MKTFIDRLEETRECDLLGLSDNEIRIIKDMVGNTCFDKQKPFLIYQVYYNSWGDELFRAYFSTMEKVKEHMLSCLPKHKPEVSSMSKAGWRVIEIKVNDK